MAMTEQERREWISQIGGALLRTAEMENERRSEENGTFLERAKRSGTKTKVIGASVFAFTPYQVRNREIKQCKITSPRRNPERFFIAIIKSGLQSGLHIKIESPATI